MGKAIDETGNKYGKWTVVKRVDNPQKNGALFLCRCECGAEKKILGKRLRAGETTQCTSCQANDHVHVKKLAGEKFGMLTVLDDYELRPTLSKDARKVTYWHCRCDCGNDTWVRTGNLQSGEVKSCGCLSHLYHGRQLEDLTGKVFFDLTVVSLEEDRINGRRNWKCQCNCGNTVIVKTSDLTTGKVKSCGCRKKKSLLPGMKFGKLTVLEETNKVTSNGCNIYLCQCECGKLHEAAGTRLRDGTIKSCGCGRFLSYNEEYIAEILAANSIPFIREKTFNDLVNISNDNKGRPLSFDFFIDNKYCLEFDGAQHFTYRNSGWDTEEHFNKTHQRDLIKNQYCFSHGIPLIRIPYDAEYTLEDLKLTSRFLLTPANESEYYSTRCRNSV